MQNITKRAFSLLLALVLCLGVLSGIRLDASAAVNYQYGTAGSYQNVIKNWGTRGETATFLSPNAVEFYKDNSITYDELALLSGSSNTSSVPTSALYKQLRALVTNNQTKTTSYDDTRALFAYTDIQANGTTTSAISSFYSGKAIGPEWDSGSTWNREHTWPNSKGDDNGNGENDIMMLRPTATSENGSRGNTAYGESGSYYDPNSVSGGTYNLHGDVARILLYVYTRWGTSYMWGSSGVIESKEVLLKWMEEDPVDTWEMGRNDSVESITGTRNVYVDYPELAFCLFNEEVPNMTTPSGEAAGTTVSYTVTATTNNTAYGSVVLNGKKITATPATGCYVTGYTVTNGTATVVRSGNVFTVTPTSDCTVQINFAEQSVVTDNGIRVMGHNVYFDEFLQIMYAVYVPEGKTIDKIELTDGNTTFSAQPFSATPSINGKTCVSYVATQGVAMQTIGTEITAKVYSDGQVVAEDRYSVLEYLHKRLSVDAEKITSIQKAMYESLLTYAASAQVVLDPDATSINKYTYVHVNNGTYNGYATGMYLQGGTISRDNLEADGEVLSWNYQIVGSTSGELTGNLTIGDKDIILTATIDETVEPSEPDTPTTGTVRFDFGANGDATHKDGTEITTDTTYTEGSYSLTLTDVSKVYAGAFDATGNSALKLGTGSYAGAFQFAVPDDVAQVVIYVAQYKANTTKVRVNDTDYTISTASTNGEYTAITVDTSTTKTVSVTTVSGGLRAMVDAILFKTTSAETPTQPTEPETEPTEPETTPTEPESTPTQPSGTPRYVEKSLSEITASDKVIITMTTQSGTVYVLTNNNGTSSAPTAATATVSGGEIAADTVQDTWLWNIAQESGGMIIYKDGSTTQWLYCNSSNNGVRVGNNTNKYFSIDATSGYLKHNATNRYVGVYTSNPDWRCYTNTTGNTANQTLRFFVLVEE